MEAVKKTLHLQGRVSGPRLVRKNAHKSIDYDLSGSHRRRRSRHGDGESEESDSSTHSQEEWSVDEFSIHGKDSVQEMNYMLRYLGLPGPAMLGIGTDAWESVRGSPSSAGSRNGDDAFPHEDLARPVDFSFVTGPDRASYMPAAFSSRRSSPRDGGTDSYFDRSQHQASPSSLRFGTAAQQEFKSPPSPALVPAEEAASLPAREQQRRVPSGGESEGSVRRASRPGFSNVVEQAIAQVRKNAEDAAAVSSFIHQHGDEQLLPRSGSLPGRMEPSHNAAEPSLISRGDPAAAGHGSVARSSSEPVYVGSSLHAAVEEQQRSTAGVAAAAAIPEGEQRNVGAVTRRSPISQGAERSRRDDEKPKSVSLSGFVGSLKRPPPMNLLGMDKLDFSTRDMLESLAPEESGVVQVIGAAASENNGEETGLEQELITVASRRNEDGDVQSAVQTVVVEEEKVLARGADGEDLEVMDLEGIGQNPVSILPEVVQDTQHRHPVGPTFPWTKGDMLGSGSFGTVYEAVDSDGMFFAVKEVSLVEQDKQAQQCIAQLMQEIELLSRFKHDNIVQYLGTERANGKLYIFLELVSKGSLASVCKRLKLSESVISSYTRQILKGLKYLHDMNIVHRDIKCANILVGLNVVKLADFGMAKQIGSLDQTKSCKGSAYWMAPEVIDPKKTYGNPADIWSLGCSILEMATGSPPFGEMEWYRVLWTVGHGNAPPIPDFLSETTKDFIKRCLEVNPKNRPTATELLEHPFVRQSGGATPASSGQLDPAIVASSLHTITEERSSDFTSGSMTSLTQSLRMNGALPGGDSNSTSS